MDLRKILLISLGHLSCDLNGGALPSLMPYLAAAHGFNYQAAGALMFAYSATSSLVQPVFGYLADKHARSWFVPLAVLLAGGSLGLVGFLDSYWAIFLTLMLCGVGGALFHPEGARYANLVSGNRKGAGMSIFSVGGNSGFVVGPLLVAGATFVAGLHGTAVFLPVHGLVPLFPDARLAAPDPPEQCRRRTGRTAQRLACLRRADPGHRLALHPFPGLQYLHPHVLA